MSEHFAQPISEQIWHQKYRFQSERVGFQNDATVEETWARIAQACVHSGQNSQFNANMAALEDFKFLPAGRITAGAGTGRNVTLFNCYVMGTVPDSLDGIFDMLKEAALTMQQGGGIGYDFSTLRPKGALVRGVEASSSGPLTFMDVWDSMCKTIMSAGSRRGAMMATMHCEHPDIFEFIEAKQDPLRLRQFNVSVLCTDKFMDAVQKGGMWQLQFEGTEYGDPFPAVDLWNAILQNTYDQAEPGVIFIDRINKENNLWFAETISATNPCGEQPLPPYGACLLGSINLTKFINDPFTHHASIDLTTLEETVRTAVRMLDAVIDTSKFPLEAQMIEAKEKRRMGLGVTGLASALFMLGQKYGSDEAVFWTESIMRFIAECAYGESVQLAIDFGPAPILDPQENREKLLKSGFMERWGYTQLFADIREHGLRNSHLLSIAPTGTISMLAGNVSSGIEPIFAPEYTRKVTNDDGTKREEKVYDYAVLKFNEARNKANEAGQKNLDKWWDEYMVTAQDLKPEDHIIMQAAAQKWVDSSISKTVNVPEEISFDDFKQVYIDAYNSGCKGCTTYRPNLVTGSVLSVEPEKPKEEPIITVSKQDMRVMDRPYHVAGQTYKLRWAGDAYYVTINHVQDPNHPWQMPFELFINTKNTEHQSWVAALTRMISAIFQRGGDIKFVIEEMKSVFDPKGGEWVQGSYVPSLVALIGMTLDEHLDNIGYMGETIMISTPETPETVEVPNVGVIPTQCPSCKGYNTVVQSGCASCRDCGYSKCG